MQGQPRGPVAATYSNVAVDDTAGGTQIVAANARRFRLAIRNQSTSDSIYLGFDADPTYAATGGWLLKAEEVLWLENPSFSGVVKGIADSAVTVNVAVLVA